MVLPSQRGWAWCGWVLSSLAMLLSFICRTTTRTGLKVTATYLDKTHATGLEVSRAEFRAIQLVRSEICPQWNYMIRPKPKITE